MRNVDTKQKECSPCVAFFLFYKACKKEQSFFIGLLCFMGEETFERDYISLSAKDHLINSIIIASQEAPEYGSITLEAANGISFTTESGSKLSMYYTIRKRQRMRRFLFW